MEKYKPRMMVELEKKGWKLLTNANIIDPHASRITTGYDRVTDEELIEDYKSRGFKEVLVTDAFDAEGNYMPRNTGMRGVYVKGSAGLKGR